MSDELHRERDEDGDGDQDKERSIRRATPPWVGWLERERGKERERERERPHSITALSFPMIVPPMD